MFKLEEHYLDEAKKIAEDHRTKKSCDHCYDRGWIGVTDDNLLVLCTKCVDMEASMESWKIYVSQHEDLKEHFADLFEEAPAEDPETDREKLAQHVHKKPSVKVQQDTFVPGQKRTGLKKV